MSARSLTLQRGGETFAIRVSGPERDGGWSATLSRDPADPARGGANLRAHAGGDGEVLVESGSGLRRLAVLRCGRGVWVGWRGRSWYLEPAGRVVHAGVGAAARDEVRAPMTGTLLEVRATPGRSVERDEVLAVLEAMKMEYRLVAPRGGDVVEVRGKPGDRVELGEVVVRLRPEAAAGEGEA